MANLFYEAWVDGSLNLENEKASVSGIIKTSTGELVMEYSKEVDVLDCSTKVEYLAMIELVNELKKLGIENAVIHSDCKNMTDAINKIKKNKFSKIKPDSQMNRLHQQAMEGLRELKYWIVKWIPRELNSEADKLSRI